jgi:hypothetical protein
MFLLLILIYGVFKGIGQAAAEAEAQAAAEAGTDPKWLSAERSVAEQH